MDVLLFLSCVGMARLDWCRTLLDLLELTGVRFATVGGLDFCCGLLERAAGNLWEETHGRGEVESFVDALLERR